MKKFLSFLKKTWLLMIVLFSPPVIVIFVFAYQEYFLGRIDMSAGEWSSLLAGAFGYWGTVILGVLAFWQNSQVQKNNDLLMRYEQSRMAPVFSAKVANYYSLSNLTISIQNITDNVACSFGIGNLSIQYPNGNTKVCALSDMKIKDYLNAHESIDIEFITPPITIDSNEQYIFSFDITAIDIVGNKRVTSVSFITKSDFIFKANYAIH